MRMTLVGRTKRVVYLVFALRVGVGYPNLDPDGLLFGLEVGLYWVEPRWNMPSICGFI